jgi:S1-C subfamily serine protease
MIEQMRGGRTAVNVPATSGAANPAVSVPAKGFVGAPSSMGAIATLPPVVDFGPAPVGNGGPFSSVVTLLRNSVVSVTASSRGGQGMPAPLGLTNPDGLPHFANPTTRSVENIGTGVIVRNDGFIVTNYHVVRGANSVFVTVLDDMGSTRYSAEIVKMDEALDLALLKISPKAPLSAAVLGDSDTVRVADEVIAIGTPFGLDMSVSRGIISAKGKSMVIEGVTHSNLLQTDAAINQGNSGGPLVATNGTVVGINTAIYTPNGAFAGIGFAVPSNKARLFVLDEAGWLPTATVEGPTMGLVALQGPSRVGVGAAGPAIMAGVPAPHTDGRQNMDCTNCHDIIPGNAGMVAAGPMIPAVAPLPPPPIPANASPPHTDGRQNMACNTCHQIIGATAGVVAFGQPGMNGYQFAQAPGSLAINVQGPRGAKMAGAGNHNLLGAMMAPMSQQMSVQTGQPAGRGVLLTGVIPNTPAATAGLRPGDILLKVDGRPVAIPRDVVAIMAEMPNGRTVRLGVLRDGDVRDMNLVVGPAGVAAAAPMPSQNTGQAGMAISPTAGAAPIMPGVPVIKPPKPPTEFNWLGMEIETFQALPPMAGMPAGPPAGSTKGAQVGEVLAGSRAAIGGLQVNDLIIEVNGQSVTGPARLDAAIKAATAAGQQILLKVNRNGQDFWIVL